MGGASVRREGGVHQLSGGRWVSGGKPERFGEMWRGHGGGGVVGLKGSALPGRAALSQDEVFEG